MDLVRFEKLFENQVSKIASSEDPAHDLSHFNRVVATAKKLCKDENGCVEIVIPAAWFHDFVIVPKNDPRRAQASRLSALAAVEFLKNCEYPSTYYDAIKHAIEAHSFSAEIPAATLEAKIVQDADRLDGLGAIGIARCFATAALMKTPFYSDLDPFCKSRVPNDRQFAVDHFFVKLFKTAETLMTTSGKAEGHKRLSVMKAFFSHLQNELDPAQIN